MDESIINKQEINLKTQCRACLSVGRKLLKLGEYLNIYKKITSQVDLVDKTITETLEICWECHALLRRAALFRIQVLKANVLLQHGRSYLCGSLSTLSTTVLNDTKQTIYINESVPKPDSDSDNQSELTQSLVTEKEIKLDYQTDTKKNNRWAQQKQIENQKPKFKLVSDYKEIFNKVLLSGKELYLSKDGMGREYCKKKYKCHGCVLMFRDGKKLKKHMMDYHCSTDQYICDVCSSIFLNKRHLSTHLRKHYLIYECTLCKKRCSGKERMNHFKSDHKTVLQCIKCKLLFCGRREFFRHFKQWHENFICDFCGISFKMRYCIIDHIRKQHSIFECKACNKTFARYNGLWLHNKLRHAPPGQTAYCVECDKRYVDIYRYRWHLANSARHKPRKRVRIPCPGCDKVFSKNIYMKDHYNLVHLNYIKYRCEECDKNFIRNADLVKHKRRVHEGILPPKNKICDVCGRGFTTNKILTNHIRTHTGERPFVCTHCPAKFAQHTSLVSHMRAVHDKRER